MTIDLTSNSPMHDGEHHRSGHDDGAGTVFGLVIVLVSIFLLGMVLLVGQAAILKHRAGNAADLSALAAADTARGLVPGEPCDAARRVAEDNGAQLVECSLVEPEMTTVDVTVGIDLPGVLSPLGQAEGVSRAGPPEDSPFHDSAAVLTPS